MIKDTNTKSSNTLYYTAFSLSALSSCATIVILTIAPYVEFLAPVVGFATLPAFIALAIISAISIFAILYKAFSKSNTIAQETEPAQNVKEVEECDNAEQLLVSPSAPIQELVNETSAGSGSGAEQPVVVASEAIHEPLVVVNAKAKSPGQTEEGQTEQPKQPNQTGKGNPEDEQDEQHEQKKGLGSEESHTAEEWICKKVNRIPYATTAVGCAFHPILTVYALKDRVQEAWKEHVSPALESVEATTGLDPVVISTGMTFGMTLGAVGFGASAIIPATVAGVGTAFNMVTTSAAVKATTTYFNLS